MSNEAQIHVPAAAADVPAVSNAPSAVITEALQMQVAGAVGAFTGDEQSSAVTAIAMLKELQPRDATEAMIVTQAIAAHHASIKAYERASIPGLPLSVQTQQLTLATKLGRAAADALAAVERRRNGSPQSVRVERVVVEEGGQAIVGQVTHGSSRL